NMGVEPYVIESSIIACAAQRLVRVLCDKCKAEYIPDKINLKLLEKYKIESKILYKPVGCSVCNNSGFSGRVGFFEVFELDENIKDMIVKRESVSNMRKYLRENGFVSLFENGLKSSAEGVVFIDEIKSVIGEIK
ncbi:MAG TPA: type II secretion system protein GspE, partial [Spirochaetota bacterium]|nr:type II secretion system protein GspE [Spirochaetota bacterium]